MLDTLVAIEREQAMGQRLGFDMSNWYNDTMSECGTTACLAGWAAIEAGWKPAANVSSVVYAEKDGRMELWPQVGAGVLGLDEREADALFYEPESLGEVYAAVAEISGVAEDVWRDKVRGRV